MAVIRAVRPLIMAAFIIQPPTMRQGDFYERHTQQNWREYYR
jgi:hypothetical protein